MNDQQAPSSLGARPLLTILRRRLWAVVLVFVVVVGAAVGSSLLQEKQYSASSSLLFRDPQLDQKLFGSSFFQNTQDPAREAATNVSLVGLDVVAERTAGDFEGLSGDDVSERVDVAAEGQSDLVSVTATDTDPERSADLANTFATQYVRFRQEADRQKIEDAERMVKSEVSDLERAGGQAKERKELEKQLDQLTVLSSLQTGNAEVVQQAEPPESPSSPNLPLNSVMGAIVGLLLGVSFALLLERLDRRIRETDEIAEIVDRPVLGVVPYSDALPNEGADVSSLPAAEFETFRIIRANLRYFNTSSEAGSVLITSPEPGDGKTTVAWNLAAAAASAGARVALLEADLRRPALRERLEARTKSGLSQILVGVSGLDEVAVPVPINESSDGRGGIRTVDVIFAGPLPPNPTDLIDSPAMEELLRRLEIRYDAVFVDTPPVSAVSDAIPLMTRVGGVLVVTRLDKTHRDALRRLVGQLENLSARTLGVVVNGMVSRRGGYGYGYGYGYESGPPGEEQPPGDGMNGYPGGRRQEEDEPRSMERERY